MIRDRVKELLMMAFLGQLLGFDSTSGDGRSEQGAADASAKHGPETAEKNSTPPGANRALVIGKKRATTTRSTATEENGVPLRKTKSDELLRDFEVMRFLCAIDERLKREEQLLSRSDLDRLQTLHAQATADQCSLLSDIIDHFEIEHEKLRYRLANAGPGSAAADALRSRRNMLVF